MTEVETADSTYPNGSLELQACLDGVQRMADHGLRGAGATAGHQVHQHALLALVIAFAHVGGLKVHRVKGNNCHRVTETKIRPQRLVALCKPHTSQIPSCL